MALLIAWSATTGEVWAALPLAPTVAWPPARAAIGSDRPDITWSGSAHDAYEMHIGWYNSPDFAQGWDSGIVSVPESVTTATSGPLVPQRTYYVFVRLHNADGWGPWSAADHHFYVAGEWLNEPYLVTPQGGSQRDASIALRPDPDTHETQYLAAYMSIGLGPTPFIGAWRLDRTGQRLTGSSEITFANGLDGCGATAATYNSVEDEYLVADRDYHAHLYGQRIDASDGTLPAASFPIHTTSATLEHAVAYASGSNVYLEAWRDDGAGGCSAVKARRFSGVDGAPMPEGLITINQDGHCVGGPRIAYNPAADEFLVVFQYVASGEQQDLYARRVSAATGALLGPGKRLLAGTGYTEWEAGVAYDSQRNRFLMAYAILGHPTDTPWGQFVDADGQPIGEPFSIATGDPFRGGAVSATWNAYTKEFLVGWNSATLHWNYARRVSQDGALVGEPFRINGLIDDEYGNLNTMVVANATDDDYLICWQSGYRDVYTRHYRAYPPAPPDTEAPAAVQSLVLRRYAQSMGLTWTNPDSEDFAGTMVRVRTDHCPTGPTDGTLVVRAANAPTTTDSAIHAGLSSGTTYYYAAFAYDEVPNYATGVCQQATVQPGDFDADADVDQEDFGHLQACLAGEAVPCGEDCRDADLNEDGHVDGADFDLFRVCLAGPGQTPGC